MTGENQQRVPQLIAFDLDYTLWDFYTDTLAAPLKVKESVVQDSHGVIIEFYPDVPQIINQIRAFEETRIAVCSRTGATTLAREALSLIQVPLLASSKDGQNNSFLPAAGLFDQTEIYQSSKITHFEKIHRNTGIPYSEMIFYDDELRNQEVESLGVTFILVTNGLDARIFAQGLSEWRKRSTKPE